MSQDVTDAARCLPATLRVFVQPGDELCETHLSWVILRGSEVYKIKKPVHFAFVDFRTLAQRRAACEAELQLNRRLAPAVYLDVVPVCGATGVGGAQAVVDWAVHMRRLADADRLDRRLAQGEVSALQVQRLVQRLCRFHRAQRQADNVDDRAACPAVLRQNIEDNFAETPPAAVNRVGQARLQVLRQSQLVWLEAHAACIEARRAAGKVCDGHGDLRAEHIYLHPDDSVDVIDCVEFNADLRVADVALDVAFLSMDLRALGAAWAAEQVLARYAECSGDVDLYRVIDGYESYRAHVRAKVAALRAPGCSAPAQQAAWAEFVAKVELAEQVLEPRPRPALLAVVGDVASGKSSVAAAVGHRAHVPVLSSDRCRKDMVGVAHDVPLAAAAYTVQGRAAVYEALLAQARTVLDAGRSVVLDATFASEAQQASLRALAAAGPWPLTWVELCIDEALAIERLTARQRTGAHASDADLQVYRQLHAVRVPIQAQAGERLLRPDARLSLEALSRQILAQWPPAAP